MHPWRVLDASPQGNRIIDRFRALAEPVADLVRTMHTIDVSDLTNPQVRSAVLDEGVIAGRVSEQLALTLRESPGEPDA